MVRTGRYRNKVNYLAKDINVMSGSNILKKFLSDRQGRSN